MSLSSNLCDLYSICFCVVLQGEVRRSVEARSADVAWHALKHVNIPRWNHSERLLHSQHRVDAGHRVNA
jgi:hypothetical protein